jgi:hypothetical protein
VFVVVDHGSLVPNLAPNGLKSVLVGFGSLRDEAVVEVVRIFSGRERDEP